ncbi:hypothetical protein IMG5_107520 [Ichthyophthirius multifiliis]|uniref:MORN repeat protein n=1 Tax=Ichthyophthirius multifiliis TaxID=5932 RepID=G0QT97_ICHMU|nr:hypothetical protein IMG5_107520 [Ichthyophthirius multifiliis]EGR31532.1 hypothetical protein IMG5_107520 [Ichthyophthirius multifiliis]|eukprot:XP_004035018.1 hypothetical protein IMG5_107520 [Ichthyophthirius multifiliis]
MRIYLILILMIIKIQKEKKKLLLNFKLELYIQESGLVLFSQYKRILFILTFFIIFFNLYYLFNIFQKIIGKCRDGYGIQTWADGAKYEGYWKDNKVSGQGKFWHVDGDIYDGQWEQDKANGFGNYIHINGATYQGHWKDDLQDGFGIEIWTDGSKYEGYYKEGKKHGEGKYIWSDNSQYIGNWFENRISGKGIYIWADGRRYEVLQKKHQYQILKKIRAIGLIIICMEKVYILGKMEENMKENIYMIKRMAMEFILGLMEEDMREIGRMESNYIFYKQYLFIFFLFQITWQRQIYIT